MAKLHLITYGCQMNEYDSERVAGLLRERRWELTADRNEVKTLRGLAAGCGGQRIDYERADA